MESHGCLCLEATTESSTSTAKVDPHRFSTKTCLPMGYKACALDDVRCVLHGPVNAFVGNVLKNVTTQPVTVS